MDKGCDNYNVALQNSWKQFCAEKDEKEKIHKAQQFLFTYHLFKNSPAAGTTPSFLSSVPSQLSCYLLQLVYDIICASISSQNVENSSTELNSHDQSQFNNLDFHPSTLILNAPSDITAIVSLREFLTNGLGRAILEFLHGCETKLITCRRELGSLLINLFPSSRWDTANTTGFEPDPPMDFRRYIEQFVLLDDGMSQEENLNKMKSTEWSVENSLQEKILYREDEFELFRSRRITSDQHAFLIIDTLMKLVGTETGLHLDEKSVTLESMYFALEAMNTLRKNRPFEGANHEIIKFKILSLIISCLNNLFSKEKNLEEVRFDEILGKFVEIIGIDFSNEENPAIRDYGVSLSLITVYILFGFLNNSLKTMSDKREEFTASVVKVFNSAKKSSLLEGLKQIIVSVNVNRICDFKEIVDIFLMTLDSVKVNIFKEITAKRKLKSKHRKKQYATQIHCKGTSLSCILEGIVLNIFNPLDYRLQITIINYFGKSHLCCCLFNIETIKLLMDGNQGGDIERQLYRILRKQIIYNLFSNEICTHCTSTASSKQFQKELLSAFIEKFQSITKEHELLNFLKHLQKITANMSNKVTEGILTSIILPVFHGEMRKVQAHNFKNTQLILTCLRTFRNCLVDSRLSEMFFIPENINYLRTLIYIPDLAHVVCAILNVGLNHNNLDEMESAEQDSLFNVLYSILSDANIYSAVLLDSMFARVVAFNTNSSRFQLTAQKQNVCEKSTLYDLLHEGKLNVTQLLNLSTTYWDLTLELCYSNVYFKTAFLQNFPLLKPMENANIANEKFSTKLVRFACNTLSCFLSHSRSPGPLQLTDSTITNNTSITLSEFCVVSSDDIMNNDQINSSHKDSINLEFVPNSFALVWDSFWSSSSISVDRRTPLSLTSSSHTPSFQSFDEVTNLMSTSDHDHNELLSWLRACEGSEVIFDIRNQSRINGVNKCCERAFLTDIGEPKIEKRYSFVSSLFTLNSLLTTSVSYLFGSGEMKQKASSENVNALYECGDIDFISDDKLKCLQTAGNCKRKLLRIFACTLAALILDYNQSKDKNMQSLLRPIRNLLLPHSRQLWGDVENANAIIQVLQTLLKVAEMNGTSLNVNGEQLPLKFSKSGNDSSQETPLNIPTTKVPQAGVRKSANEEERNESEIDMSDNEAGELNLVGTDEGYEADAEVLVLSDSSLDEKDIFRRYNPSSKYRAHIVNEGLCNLVVEVLMELTSQCIRKPENWVTSLTQLVKQLSAVRDSLGGTLFLIKGFSKILSENDFRLKDLQLSILDLISDLRDPDCLAAYLNILATENPPVDILLQHMAAICNHNFKVTPYAAIKFPLPNDASVSYLGEDAALENIKQIRNLHEIHEVDSLFTRSPCFLPISNGNIKPFSEEGFTVSTWIQIDRHSDSSRHPKHCEETHILSFGTQQLIISLYVNEHSNLIVEFHHPTSDISSKHSPTDAKSLTPSSSSSKELKTNKGSLCKLRRSRKLESSENPTIGNNSVNSRQRRSEGSAFKHVLQTTKHALFRSLSGFSLLQNAPGHILHGARIELDSIPLKEDKWTHLCVTVQKQGKALDLTIILDGTVSSPFELPWSPQSGSIKINFEMITIGEMYPIDMNQLCSDHEYINYSLSNLLVFKKCLNRGILANLTALGPDCNNLIYCQAGNSIPNYGLLDYHMYANLELHPLQESLKFLRYNLILIYSVHEPNYLLWYSHDETGPNILGKRQDVILYTKMVPTKIPSLQNATYICGGLSCLLILFAKAVELTNKPEIQAIALNILFRVAFTDSRLYTEFIKRDTLNLIGSVIKTSHCSKSVHLLKVILNNACSGIVCDQKNGEIQLVENLDVCVVYPNLIVNTIKRYSDWSTIDSLDSTVIDMILQCIQDLVSDKQIQQNYNTMQFIKAGLVRELLNLCKIYLVEAPIPVYFSKKTASLFINILNTFAGAPPSPSLLDEITKLLLILQRPNECYVTDNRSRFYFLLTSDIPSKSRLITLPLSSNKIRLSIRNRKSPFTGSEKQFQSRGEFKITNCEHLMNRKAAKSRHNRFTNFIYDYDTLQTIANCSGIDERKLCVVRREHNERFRKFLLELKKKQFLQSQLEKNDNRRTIRKKSKRLRTVSDNDNARRVRTFSSTEDDIMLRGGFDIVHSDEISSLEETQGSKGTIRSARVNAYHSVGVIAMQNGLFTLLRDYLLVLPDSAIDEVLAHYVKLEIILVLANHRSCDVRTSILKLLMVFCERLLPSELQVVTKKMYWHHLANQLALHPVDGTLMETCLEWVTCKPGFSINFEEISDQELKIHNKIGLNALLAMSVQTVQNTNLAANVFKVIEYIYRTDPVHNMLMIESGVIQSTVKALQKIYLEIKVDYRKTEYNIRDLLTTIAKKSVCSNGHINVLWELLNILSYYGSSNFTKVVYGFRSIQAHILLSLIQMFLRENVHIGLNIKLKDIQLTDSNLSSSETRTRFELLIDRSIQFFISISDSYHPSAVEVQLFELLIILSLSGNSRCSSLIGWGLAPNRILTFKSSVTTHLLALLEQSNALPNIICDWKMVKAFLWKYQSLSGINGECSPVSKVCKKLLVTENDLWSLEESVDKLELSRSNCLTEQKPMIEKALYRFESIAQTCTDTAMSITRIVADLQNSERKHLLNLMRQYDESFIYAEWKLVIQRMTHEGTPWHCPSLYPKSWELDDTEGPLRSRTRLRRCTLNINPRFIMPDFRASHTENQPKTYPLKYLISSHDQQMNFSLNAQILFNFPAKFLPVDGEIDGELIVTEEKIFFAATHRYKFFYINAFIDNITEIWIRRYQHQENAFEFFISSNKSFFFVVENPDDRVVLREIFADKIVVNVDPVKLMQQWKEGRLTNWEYLMTLNQLAGRTYNDLMQYPVFPWILADYTSECLDLTQRSSYRKLDKPIAVQHKENEQHYLNNYGYISNSMTNGGGWELKPYHYSSHYSNSGTVLHFLVRIPPFTKFFLRYQDNNFDIPDRTFHSLNTTWKLASKDSPTDVKELIPEFFCLPEMFENFEGFDFGVRQNGEIVNHVMLPPWCWNNPRLFVLIHRQALESEMVRKNLHNWIDLIFGYKQTGQPAVDALNVFHPATYSDFEFSAIKDPIERQAVQTMVKTYGQMPRQLFKTLHDSSAELNYSPHQPSVLTSVKGLRWGIFTGSPQLEDPKICSVFKQPNVPFSVLLPFESKNMLYGLYEKSSVMLGTDSEYNLVSWHYDDFIVRVQPLNDNIHSSKPLLFNDPADPISCCGSHSSSNVLWFGHSSGKITVYHCTNHDIGKSGRNRHSNIGMKLSYNSAFRRLSLKLPSRLEEYESLKENKTCKYDLGTIHWSGPTVLVRHTDEVTAICISIEFKIVVSIGKDGLAVIWDLNSLNYIRTIDRPSEIRHSPLNIVIISPTLGDIFTVHSIEPSEDNRRISEVDEECFEVTEENLDDFVNVAMNYNGQSIMRLHSVNGKYVSHNIQEERMLCACYSYIKEGVGVNIIATGFEGGIVKLWSSWDLSLIREIIVSQLDVLSLTFSTYQHLAVLTKDYIQIWDSEGLLGDPPKLPQFMLHKGINA